MVPYNEEFEPTAQGVFDIPEAPYRKIRALNVSYMKLLVDRSPLHFKTVFDDPASWEPTLPMLVGTAFHWRMLEPDKFRDKITIEPAWNKNTKKYKEWKATQPADASKIILAKKYVDHVQEMARCSMKKRTVRDLLSMGWAERAILWKDPEFDIWMKGKIDFIPEGSPGTIIDLKKTLDASQVGFVRSIWRYKYNWGAAHYLDGITACTGEKHSRFLWVAVESEPPYESNVLEACIEDVDRARVEMYGAKELYAECLNAGRWPGYLDEIVDLGGGYVYPEYDEGEEEIPY